MSGLDTSRVRETTLQGSFTDVAARRCLLQALEEAVVARKSGRRFFFLVDRVRVSRS